ncbi:MAG: LCP family protein, partial [Desulfocucumaceae bacterium]
MGVRSGYRLKSKAKLIFFVFLMLGVLVSGGCLYAFGFLDDIIASNIPGLSGDEGFKGKINVLALGVDARKGEKMARTDTIMLFSVDTDKNLMSVLSIPRDTKVNIPGHGTEKINSATLYGGPQLAMKTVSDLLGGIKVDKYVMTNYEGFKDIVDALGGVSIDIKERMYHYDPQDGGIYTIDLKPGVQRLNGEKSLQYVRYRGYALGDISRAEHQQRFLSALASEMLQPSSVVKLPILVPKISKAIETNLSLSEMRKLGVDSGKMINASMVSQTLPVKFID